MGAWDNRRAVWCGCGRCAITVDKIAWQPWRDDPGNIETCLAFWESGPRPGFFLRLRLAWGLLIRGDSANEVLLDENQRLDLIAALNAEPERFLT